MQLGVGQAAVIVDDGDDVGVAGAARAVLLGATAGEVPRADRTWAASWCRGATAPPAPTTHSAGTSAGRAWRAVATRHGGPGPCRSCRGKTQPVPPAAPAHSESARAP